MKVYRCDSCGMVIDDPYEVKMKEFYVGVNFNLPAGAPEYTTWKGKIHLCDDCFKALCEIAKGVVESTKEEG